MTKLMTAMIALDYCSLDEIMTIKASDIQTGSGDTFYDGDTISVRDALLAMLLPSSNTLAVAFSRFVGNKILNIKNN
jgi:D-alanyl-D-alanine carboxypeptidase